MSRLSESRFNYGFLCLMVWLGFVRCQDPFGDLPTNSQLWKSFQEEMKTLEQAAHRVNTLLSEKIAENVKGLAADDQEAKPSDNTPDVTVLTSPGGIKDDVRTQPEATTPEEVTENAPQMPQNGGVSQTLKPHFSLGSFMNSFGFFNNLPEPWWRGKNVCVEKSEKVEEKNKDEKTEVDKHILIMGTGTFEHCKQTAGKYICTTVISTPQQTKTLSTTYQCCEGYRRQAEGCVEVELKDPITLMEAVDSKQFAEMLTSNDIMKAVADKNVTIFAPVDEAMKSYKEKKDSNQIRQRRAVEEWGEVTASPTDVRSSLSASDVAMAHMTDGLMDVDDFTNEMVLNSLYNETPLRVNIYPGREDAVITVNCARLRSSDNYATHARVHTLDRVLQPVTQTVTDVLSQPQFSQFKQFLQQQGLWERLENSTAVTVFAPNNEAWNKLGGLKDKYSRGEACIDKVLRHHILPLTLCSAPSTEGRLTTADVDGELVRISRNDDDQMMVDERGRVVQEDIVASNGVVHMLDKVLTPKSAKPLSDLLASSNHTTFLSLLDRAGLLEEMNRQENITVFVPTESALSDEATAAMLDSLDTDALRRVLLYHISERAPSCDLKHHAELRTRQGGTLRVTMYNPNALFSGVEPRAAVQCAPLARMDGKACHAVAHEVTRLLLPPNNTVLQLVNDNPELSVLRRVIEGTELEKDLDEKTRSELLSEGFTLLAPSDDAFNKLDEDLLNKLLTDKKYATEVLRRHLLGESVCCASITPVPWPFTNSVRTLEGKKLEVNRDRRNRVVFGTATAEKCDNIATDGLVHVIDNVLLPEATKVKLGNVVFGSPDHKIMLFGI
ncbi:transforming growth factor-beta-induced protein ig-h3-like [Macrosteles quadrilineatus]|uniref:transforming growth factor-beta-induced protein ig-h3-like n=1 Tax=Macrosteles quadrilineatus TaxID=74068 RepID=UPI0023E20B32|nr:transforming growth factor-beta-induced protein ig-h3-like [Macrosteles quadrilineatus]